MSHWLVVGTMRLAERIVVVGLGEGCDVVGYDGAVDRLGNALLELAPCVVDLM